MTVYDELSRIQKNLVAPKGQWNDYSKFKYRSCEDILEAVKPLLGECVVILNDSIVEVGGRIYVCAQATLFLEGDGICVQAFAREEQTKKGMDAAQITGSASSYARKYALNGLFAIDDVSDADTRKSYTDELQEGQPEKAAYGERGKVRDALNEIENLYLEAIQFGEEPVKKAWTEAFGSRVEGEGWPYRNLSDLSELRSVYVAARDIRDRFKFADGIYDMQDALEKTKDSKVLEKVPQYLFDIQVKDPMSWLLDDLKENWQELKKYYDEAFA